MLYEEFKKRFVADIKKEFSDYDVEETPVTKSNENVLDGVTVRMSESIGPVIYVNYLYENLANNSDLTYEELFEDVCNTYRKAFESAPSVEDLKSSIMNWETAKTLLRARPILKKDNLDYLEDKPYKEYLDFAIVYYLDLGEGIAHVPYGLMDSVWHINEEELHETAMSNMENVEYIIRDLDKMFGTEEKERGFLALTVANSPYGANTILMKKALNECAETLGCDEIIVIPSSTQEVLILRKEADSDLGKLRRLLLAMNITMEDRNVLSDHLYFYNSSTEELTA